MDRHVNSRPSKCAHGVAGTLGEISARAANVDRSPEANLLIGASGAAAVMSLPSYLLELQKASGWRLRVVLTHTAARIMPPATVALVSEAVFGEGQDSFSPGHVRLARWASHVIVLPATAHMLAQAAHGLAGSLLAATLLAYPRPVLFFPTMNLDMWQQRSVQRNIAMLRADGHHVVEPCLTRCWEIASGNFRLSRGLPDPTEVAKTVAAFAEAASDVAAGQTVEDGAAVNDLSKCASQTGHSQGLSQARK